MTRVPLHAVKPQLCIGGACDLEAPLGTIRFSTVQFQSLNGKRSETSFRVAYQTARATCSGPVARPDGLPLLPFVCTIAASDDLPVTLNVASGCLTATLEPTKLLGSEPAFKLETDVVGIGGARFPGNEIALLDLEGVRALRDLAELVRHDPVRATRRHPQPLADARGGRAACVLRNSRANPPTACTDRR